MLDYIVTAKRNPEFTAPLVLIPTAINFDRVLEDRNLTEELIGKEDRRTKGEKLRTSFDFLFKSFFRGVFKRFKRYGYAVVSFGTPVVVDEFARQHPGLLAPEFEARKPHLQELAERVMREISAALPVTPVSLVARVLTERPVATEAEIIHDIDAYFSRWRDRVWLIREKTGREIWAAARKVLELRHLIQPAEKWRSDLFQGEGVPIIEDAWQWNPRETLLRDYYANSLLTFDEVKQRGWPERRQAVAS
jgi:glycerol-3-phosphate O-acyltransferase